MEAGAISMRYAKALANYAMAKGVEDIIYKEAYLLSQSLLNHSRLKEVLISPVLARIDKKKLLVTASGTRISLEFERFIDLVLEQKRESYLQFMMMSYIDLYRHHKRIGTATLITAVPISEELKEEIQNTAAHLLHAQMEMQTEVDSKIEGGFIFDIEGYRLDASVATQIKQIKQQFIDKNRRIV